MATVTQTFAVKHTLKRVKQATAGPFVHGGNTPSWEHQLADQI